MSNLKIKSTVYPPSYPPCPSTASYLRWCRMTGASMLSDRNVDRGYITGKLNIKQSKP